MVSCVHVVAARVEWYLRDEDGTSDGDMSWLPMTACLVIARAVGECKARVGEAIMVNGCATSAVLTVRDATGRDT
jgi:hypothetical protein